MAVTISQLIDVVREQLLTPSTASSSEAMYPFLFVEEVELEVTVTVSETIDGKGKVNIQVVELGGGLETTNDQMHRMRIKMTPLLTKAEIRTRLEYDSLLWEGIEGAALRATTKETGLIGEE